MVIVLIIVSAGAGYFVGSQVAVSTKTTTSTLLLSTTLTSTSTTTATTVLISSSFQGCATEFSPLIIEGTESNSSWIVFDTNSTAWVCVEAVDNSNSSVSYSGPPTVWMVKNGTWVSSTNLEVTVQPPKIELSANAASWYVFQITPLNGTRAIYNVGLPYPCWSNYFLVAVGYSVKELQGSKLSIPGIDLECPAYWGGITVIGITNFVPTYSE